MTTVDIGRADEQLGELIRRASVGRTPLVLRSEGDSAVLIGADQWRSIEETLYLLSIPGMRETIRDGLATPPEECSGKLQWRRGQVAGQ
jgi:prevent-host-death family protein